MTRPSDVAWSRSRGRAVSAVPTPLGGHADFSVPHPRGELSWDGSAPLTASARGSFQGHLGWYSQQTSVQHLRGGPGAGAGIGETLLSKNSWR